jgi:hypothetical protein
MRSAKHVLLALIAAAALLASVDAHAQASQHERAKAEPIMDGGQIVGLRLKLTLRPNDRYRNVVRVGLGPITATGGLSQDNRDKASDFSKGYLVHQWPEIKFADSELTKPSERTLEVLFKDAPNLKPGMDVEVLSTWNNLDANGKYTAGYWHVWGLQTSQVDKASVVKVPGTPTPAATTASTHAAPARGRLPARRMKSATTTTTRRLPARSFRSRTAATRTR